MASNNDDSNRLLLEWLSLLWHYENWKGWIRSPLEVGVTLPNCHPLFCSVLVFKLNGWNRKPFICWRTEVFKLSHFPFDDSPIILSPRNELRRETREET